MYKTHKTVKEAQEASEMDSPIVKFVKSDSLLPLRQLHKKNASTSIFKNNSTAMSIPISEIAKPDPVTVPNRVAGHTRAGTQVFFRKRS